MSRTIVARTFQMGALGVALLFCARSGSSQTDRTAVRRACSTAFKTAKQLEQSGHLVQAKDQFLSCAKTACGAVLRSQCTSRYTQLDSDIPSVVPLVTDESGDPRVDVEVKMDGQPLASRLDGRALPIDPGLHEFSFNADGSVLATQKVMIVQGQRNRPITVSMQPDKGGKRTVLGAVKPTPALDAKAALEKPAVERPFTEKPERESAAPEKSAPEKAAVASSDTSSNSDTPPSEAPPKRGGPGAMPYVLGAAGLAGVGSFGLLTYWGRKDNNKLAQCAPYCSQDSVDHIRKLYLAADISLGVGIAALGAAATWMIASPGGASEERANKPRYVVDVRPTPAGAFASVSGTF